MIEAHFTLNSCDYASWREVNQRVERIIINGNVTYEQAEAFAKAFEYDVYKEIILDDFSIKESMYDDEMLPYREVLLCRFCEFGKPLMVFEKIYLNHLHYGLNEFMVKNDSVFSKDGAVLVHIPPASELVILGNVKHIGEFACCTYDMLTHLRLNEGLESIDDYAFGNSGIRELVLPDSVNALGESAFECCDYLERIKLSENLTELPDFCFNYVMLKDGKLDIPSSIMKFGCCSLPWYIDEIIVPEGVTEIESETFFYPKRVFLPSTLRKLSPDFYYDIIVKDKEEAPFIEVHPDNPVFFSRNGSIYFRDGGKCAIDSEYIGKDKA